jgi:hypothetical protein
VTLEQYSYPCKNTMRLEQGDKLIRLVCSSLEKKEGGGQDGSYLIHVPFPLLQMTPGRLLEDHYNQIYLKW